MIATPIDMINSNKCDRIEKKDVSLQYFGAIKGSPTVGNNTLNCGKVQP